MTAEQIVFGTRGSPLARWQTDWVAGRLRQAHPHLTCHIRAYTTAGDRNLTQPLPQIGGKGLFTEELETALRAGEIDAAVHSLKDLPVVDAAGLALGAIGQRADARDVLVASGSHTLHSLPPGARVGTCSLRRTAQLLNARPDLNILPVRGNVDTRIRKARNGEYDAILLAAAGVQRLGLSEQVNEYLEITVMLPAPGQAALAVQCRADDARVLELLATLDHAPTRAAVTAERAFLQALGGGCAAPVAAYATWAPTGLALTGLVASEDGRRVIRETGQGPEPHALGRRLAAQVLARGAGELLK